MRKTSRILIALVLAAVLLAGCGAGSSTKSSTSTSSSGKTSSNSSGSKSHKVLVVYFSGSGNTEAVAKETADETGADTFKITPKDPYTDDDLDWTNDDSRVNKEHNDTSLQDQVELESTKVDNWDSYDVVFFGYPIWWGNAAWPVNQFVQNNDFSGKTVIPFCTSSSSDIGSSGEKLAKMAGTGDWQKGMRFEEKPEESDVKDWAKQALADL